MARRQVIVQLDDQIVAALDVTAKEEGVSRSELIRAAALALLEKKRIAREEQKMIEGYRRHPQDPDLVESFGRLASETVPPY